MVRQNNILRPPEDAGSFSKCVPEIFSLAEIDFVNLLNLDSTNMNPSDWTAMANAVNERISINKYDGFVLAHGTDTMHFSASALAFAFGPKLNTPVVFTNAQTDMSVLHGDARINLIRAVRVALEPLAEVVICFGNHVYRGCRTQKKDEKRFDAFESPAFYPIADITENILIHPNARRTIARRSPGDGFAPNFHANILCISLIPGLLPRMLAPLLNQDSYDGIILQSFGAGNVPNREEYSFTPFIERATECNIPIVITSQFPANSTLETHYEPGIDAINRGAIPTGNMTSACATVKLYWVLSRVNEMIKNNEITEKQKISRVRSMMQKPYIDEFGFFAKGWGEDG